MRFVSLPLLVVVAAAATFAAPACSDFDDGGATADAGGEAETGAGDGGAGLDRCVDTPSAPECLDDATALFVSPAGDDGAEGSRAALGKISPARKRIYLCDGTYAADFALDTNHAGVALIGGFDCAWNPNPALKPVLGASANPFKASNVSGLALVDLALVAKDAASGNSIAAFVSGGDITFKRVRLEAGNAAKGDDGVLKGFDFPDQAELNGNNAPNGTAGGPEKEYTCPGGAKTIGGKGGDIGSAGATGSPGPANGGSLGQCELASQNGGVGAAGASPAASSGASTLGEMTAEGWKPAAGTDGQSGGPGQGGGGGGGYMGAGGGGGAGGCGGAGGGGGKGGGASIALAAHNATVTLTESALVAKNAGNGGGGAPGQPGQTAFGSRGTGSGSACNGGNGGPGGNGASGGGGAGGVSVGALYKGSKPSLDTATEQAIKLGSPGNAGVGPDQNNGLQGDAKPLLESP